MANTNFKISKKTIENIAKSIIRELKKKNLANDVCIYFNNKRISIQMCLDPNDYTKIKWVQKIEENINPHDYFEYAAYDHIISMSFEGAFYDYINYSHGSFPNSLEKEFKELGIYWELGDAWNCSFYPVYDDMDIEYTKYEKPKSAIHIYHHSNCLPELKLIMKEWYDKSKTTGDSGGCVLGAGFEFEYKGDKYYMSACSPWQGEGSWTPHVSWVKQNLEFLGAINIQWHCGRLD